MINNKSIANKSVSRKHICSGIFCCVCNYGKIQEGRDYLENPIDMVDVIKRGYRYKITGRILLEDAQKELDDITD